MAESPFEKKDITIPDSSIKKNAYFLSDAHLGIPDYESSLKREKLLVRWLDSIKSNAKEIYLLGDIFDFWFEYKSVIPKGYTRLFYKLIEMTEAGIDVYYFTGNHDMWSFDYFQRELNIKLFKQPVEKYIGKKFFMIGHGDGLGPGDNMYKLMKKIFQFKLSHKLFSFFHPRIGISLANFFSRLSRTNNVEDKYKDGKERLVLYCKSKLKKKHFDFFVFGHRHLPMAVKVGDSSLYVNTGDWMKAFSYVVFDGEELKIEYFRPEKEAAQGVKP